MVLFVHPSAPSITHVSKPAVETKTLTFCVLEASPICWRDVSFVAAAIAPMTTGYSKDAFYSRPTAKYRQRTKFLASRLSRSGAARTCTRLKRYSGHEIVVMPGGEDEEAGRDGTKSLVKRRKVNR